MRRLHAYHGCQLTLELLASWRWCRHHHVKSNVCLHNLLDEHLNGAATTSFRFQDYSSVLRCQWVLLWLLRQGDVPARLRRHRCSAAWCLRCGSISTCTLLERLASVPVNDEVWASGWSSICLLCERWSWFFPDVLWLYGKKDAWNPRR